MRRSLYSFALVIALCAAAAMVAASEIEADEAESALSGPESVEDVAEALPADSEVEADPQYTERERAHLRFLELLDAERYADALLAARQVVKLTREEFGPETEQMIVPRTNLATALVSVDEFVEAEENYKAAILLIEKYEGFLSPRLINPLIGLGGVYNRSKRYDLAISVFERALRTNHVNEGFTNIEQLPIRDGLTESYIGLREADEANFQQETQLEIHRRRFGVQSRETAAAYKKLGDWYARSGQVEPALDSYTKADRIYCVQADNVLYDRVAALEALAQLYQRLGQLGTSSSVLRRALEIVDDQPNIDFPLRARVLVDLGDLYTIFNKLESAGKRYLQAWNDLSREDEFVEVRDAFFDQPVRVAGVRLSNYASTPQVKDAPRSRVRDGYVLISYTVTPLGRVTDVKIVESDPPDVMDDKIVSMWQRSKFRPRYVDGEPVATENLLLRHDFKHALEEPEKREASGDNGGGELEYPGKKLD